MGAKKELKTNFFKTVFGCFFAIITIFAGLTAPIIHSADVFADPETVEDTDNTSETPSNLSTDDDASQPTEDATEDDDNTTQNNTPEANNVNTTALTSVTGDQCQDSLGSIGWLVCPTTGKIAEAVDWLYGKLEDILIIDPVSLEEGSPIYQIWQYFLGITNIVFIIFVLVVVYSQVTGIGISNYGIKKVLPKLIVTAVLVNLSFLICIIAVDISNIIGSGLRDVFTNIEETVLAGMTSASSVTTAAGDLSDEAKLSYADMYSSLAGGTGLTIGGAIIAFETGAIWMLIPVVLGAVVAVASGLITIALRQAVVTLLIMISPLAIVAYMLPNTEQWYKKWKHRC